MKRRILLVCSVSLAALLLTVSVVYAYAAYHGSWSEQPYWGNHWWYNNTPSSAEVTWYADDSWTSSGATALRNGRNNFPWNEYRIEQEAYDPANYLYCDYLILSSFTALGLPITGYTNSDACGTSSAEELKIELDENSISGGVWYRHKAVYIKNAPPTWPWPAQVNYSFSHNHTLGDSWLGKINYRSDYDWTSSDPSGLVN